jgi:hypothetical protein
MIIYPAGYDAAETAAGRPLYHPRILYKNYLRNLSLTNITASGESSEFPRDAPLRPETNEWWQAPSLAATWEADLGSNLSVSAIGVAGLPNISGGISLGFDTQLDGGTWTAFSLAHVPSTPAPILYLDSPRTIDRVRLTITSGGGTEIPKIASIFVGPTLTMQRPLQVGYRPPNWSRKAIRQAYVSRGGHYLGQEMVRRGLEGRVDFRGVTESWYDANFDDFANTAQSYPYFFAPRPDVFTSHVVYGWHDREIEPVYHASYYVSFGWNITAIQND